MNKADLKSWNNVLTDTSISVFSSENFTCAIVLYRTAKSQAKEYYNMLLFYH